MRHNTSDVSNGKLRVPILNPAAPVRKLRPQKPGGFAPVQPVRGFAPPVLSDPEASAKSVHTLGVYCLSAYLFAGYANDLSLRVFGGKAYLSWLAGILMLVAFTGCGTQFRGLKSIVGKAWFGMMCCVIVSAGFSIFRSGSGTLLESYIPRALLLFFYTCAFALTIRQCRTLVVGNVVSTCAILLCAVLFGSSGEGGRFSIPDSLFFSGANDLALALVSSLGFILFLISQKSILAQLLGAVMFLTTVWILLKTGSRGGFIALAVFIAVWLIFSSKRWKLGLMVVPAIAIVVIMPGSTLKRLVEIATPGSLNAGNASDEALESQMERTMLLQKSIEFALEHPMLGVGPGEFTDALYLADMAQSTHTHALGTHNTYTQVASECGMPALFFYLVALCGSIGSNFRIMARTRRVPGAEDVFTMSLCLFGNLIAFGVGTIFHHDAYSGTLPVLTGLSIALALASRNGDPRWIEVEKAAGRA